MEIRTALKALADETRYAVYEEIATATTPLSAAELAERLGFHPNTVRLHLERLRETGLVDVEAAHRGSVGRPQHLYTLAAGAPGVVLQPAVQVVLAGLLADLAERAGAGIELAQATGRVWGTEAGRRARERSCVEALTTELDGLGFEPDLHQAGGEASIAFLACPFREPAEAYPELVCNLHRGICEGIVAEVGGGTIDEFATLYDHQPCRVTVAVGASDRD